MKAILKPDMLEFMMDIRFNNNKEYFLNHKEEYERKVKEPYHRLIEALASTMLEIDSGMEVRPYKVLSRIYRDTRFSKDKSPIRDHHWLAFRHEGEPRDQAVMFWFEIRIEAVSWGLGFWGENKKAMEALRRRMCASPDEITRLLQQLRQNDFVIEGSSYSRMQIPDELPKELHQFYKLREINISKANINPEMVFKPGFEKVLAADYLALAPMYRLLRGFYELTV